ncbi:hypothetical protein ACFWAF_03285 [Streptomyces microflavus]|uniref:hypothetical protein n=1 Tax=Streptomyces microflavus TaxID=1919 RepID=UPI003657FF2D
MPAYNATYIDKKLKVQVTKRVYSRDVAAAVRRARRSDGMVQREYVGGETVTVTLDGRYEQVFRAVSPGSPKPDETHQVWQAA